MTYSVLWSPEAERELSAILGSAPNSGAVTQAFLATTQLLQNDPDRVGESRPKGRRIAFLSPLGLHFELHWRERTVLVLHVWWFGPHGRRP